MKAFVSILLLQLITLTASAQRGVIDSLKKQLESAKEDTNKVNFLAAISFQFLYSNPDSAILFAQQGYNLAQQLNYPKGEALCLNRMAIPNIGLGNAPKALELLQKSRTISEKINDRRGLGRSLNNIANIYGEQGDYAKALPYLIEVLKIKEISQTPLFGIVLENIGDIIAYSHFNFIIFLFCAYRNNWFVVAI